jgi:phenylalanyl-tRNA synthetase beta chain
MKVSLNWIKQYTDLELGLDELVEKISSQLGAVEQVTDLGKVYQGIVVAKVVEVKDHPDADRLHVCRIDDGGRTQGVERDSDGYVQVVCGAPNVHDNMLAAWLPPGTTVPESVGKDPLVLEIREIRGHKSYGMLASPRELLLGDNHEGLLEVTVAAQPGDSFADALQLNDQIVELENKMFTHRPDCFGQLGIARELAGILGHPFVSPLWYKTPLENPLAASDQKLPLVLRNELPELVPRFVAVVLSDIAIKPLPIELQTYLMRVGVRPVNNVVDLTNYMMLLTGQPMHAYDYDKVKALSGNEATLVVRYPKPGEKLTLLGNKVVEPRSEAIIIATDNQAIGLGGVMGGAETEVDEQTKNVLLECATFDMYSIRRTAMASGLFTDAVTRYTKGQSPLQNDRVVAETIRLLGEQAGAKQASQLIDDNHVGQRQWIHPPVPVTAEFINSRLGLQLTAENIKQLLENVECTVTIDNDTLTVTAPFWRTDIELREDVVEEVGRLNGYDKLPLQLPQRDLTPAPRDPLLELKANLRRQLSKFGANEVLTYSFVHGNLLDKVHQDRDLALQIANALSPELQYYRLSLTPSLLDKIYPNLKAGYDEFAIFETGKAHIKTAGADDSSLPAEFNRLALVYVHRDKTAKKTFASGYYEAQKYLTDLLTSLGLSDLKFLPYQEPGEAADRQSVRPFEPARSSMVQVNQKVLGVLGEYNLAVRQVLKLPTDCAGFELDVDVLLSLLATIQPRPYTTLSRFPKVDQDICLKVPAATTYQQVFEFVWQQLSTVKPDHSVAHLVPVDIYQRPDDTDHKQITLRLSLASYDRTLTDTEVNDLLDKVAEAAKTDLQAERL